MWQLQHCCALGGVFYDSAHVVVVVALVLYMSSNSSEICTLQTHIRRYVNIYAYIVVVRTFSLLFTNNLVTRRLTHPPVDVNCCNAPFLNSKASFKWMPQWYSCWVHISHSLSHWYTHTHTHKHALIPKHTHTHPNAIFTFFTAFFFIHFYSVHLHNFWCMRVCVCLFDSALQLTLWQRQ